MGARTTRLALLTTAMTALVSASGFASAQDVVVMRRVIAPPTRGAAAPTPTPTPTATPAPTPTPTTTPRGYYSWQVSSWQQQPGACGSTGTQTRTVQCVRTDGATVADGYCSADNSGPKPLTSEPTTITASCAYAWAAGPWNVPQAACGSVAETRVVSCLRSDGSQADPSLCGGDAPLATGTVQATAGCSYAWAAGQWQGAGCGTVTQTRSVLCQRSDGTPVDDSSCQAQGAKPGTTQQIADSSTCGYQWHAGDPGAPAPACGATTRTRAVTCERGDGATVADSLCAASGDKPSTTVAATDLSTCVYSWKAGGWGAPSTTCGDATSTQTVTCVDQNGNAAPDPSSCSYTPAPPTSRTTHEVSSCTFSWQNGAFGSPQPACGNTIQSRTVSCLRSDGTTVADASCDPGSQPAATQPATDYSACTFAWSTTAWSSWSTTCGDATQTRGVTCLRADGTTATDAQCASAGAKPAVTQASHQTAGCAYQWVQSGFGAVTPACGATSSSQTVSCLRADGVTMTGDDEQQCVANVGPKPATTKPGTDYSTCTFQWNYDAYSAPSTTCGSATQTRNASCLRSDGTTTGTVDSGANTHGDPTGCSAAYGAAVVSQSSYQTSGCTFSWVPSAYGAPTPACGASTQTRSFTCTRSDGQTAQTAASCGTNTQPSSQSTTDYSTCGYQWNVRPWQNTAACGVTVTQNRVVTCLRSDGTDGVDDSLCTPSQGPKPATSQTISDYSQCSYSWTSTPGAWSSTCSTTATRPETVACQRQDGQTVADSYCSAGTKPPTQDTSNLSGCSYTPTYGAYGTCSSSTSKQTATLTKCMRGDGVDVTAYNSQNNYPYCAQTATQTCTPTYTPIYTYGVCTPTSQGVAGGTETGTFSACQANDGQMVANTNCTAAQRSAAPTRSCTISGYTPTYGSYGTCANSTQSANIATCSVTASDGVGNGQIPTSLCPSSTQTNSRSCTSTITCSALVSNGQWGDDSSGFTKLGTAGSVSAAQAVCTGAKKAMLCGYNSAQGNVYTWGSSTSIANSNSSALYVSTCK